MTYMEILSSPEAKSYYMMFQRMRRFYRRHRTAPSEVEELYNVALHNYRLYVEKIVMPYATAQNMKNMFFITGK